MTGQAAGERIAVSLVTGFLGSGKTTLIAALLKQPAMAGTAVIVNEFGAVGIDDAIFAEAVGADNVLLLANGCLCCAAGDDLAATVWSLARRAHGRPRRIVIETSGLAEPAPLLRRLISDPRLLQATRLDTVVATIDANTGISDLDRHPVAARQCAFADRRIITKADLAEAEDVTALTKRLREMNAGADVRAVVHGRIDAGELFGASLHGGDTGHADVDRWLGLAAHRDAHGDEHDHARIGAWLIDERQPVNWDRLSRDLGTIVALHGDVLLRVKGVIQTTEDPRPLVIHGVQRVFHPPVRLERWSGPPGTSIVAIGDRGAAHAVRLINQAVVAAVVPAPASALRTALSA